MIPRGRINHVKFFYKSFLKWYEKEWNEGRLTELYRQRPFQLAVSMLSLSCFEAERIYQRPDYEKEKIIGLPWSERVTDNKLRKVFGTSSPTIGKNLRRLGLKARQYEDEALRSYVHELHQVLKNRKSDSSRT